MLCYLLSFPSHLEPLWRTKCPPSCNSQVSCLISFFFCSVLFCSVLFCSVLFCFFPVLALPCLAYPCLFFLFFSLSYFFYFARVYCYGLLHQRALYLSCLFPCVSYSWLVLVMLFPVEPIDTTTCLHTNV